MRRKWNPGCPCCDEDCQFVDFHATGTTTYTGSLDDFEAVSGNWQKPYDNQYTENHLTTYPPIPPGQPYWDYPYPWMQLTPGLQLSYVAETTPGSRTYDPPLLLSEPVGMDHRLEVQFYRILRDWVTPPYDNLTTTWRAVVAYRDPSGYYYGSGETYAFCEHRHVQYFAERINGVDVYPQNRVWVRLGQVINGTTTYLTDEVEVVETGNWWARSYVCYSNGVVSYRNAHSIDQWSDGTNSVLPVLSASVTDPSAFGTRAGVMLLSHKLSNGDDYRWVTTQQGDFLYFGSLFSRLIVTKLYDHCPSCRCLTCEVGTMPASVVCEIAGVTAGTCNDPDFWNLPAFVLDMYGAACEERIVLTPPCGYSQASIRLTWDATPNTLGGTIGTYQFRLGISLLDLPTKTQSAVFSATLTDRKIPSDCATLVDQLVLTYNAGESASNPSDGYDFTNATVTISLP